MTDEAFSRAERAIGYAFRDRALLETALTHSSFVNEHGGRSNERLEFLGDALVGFLVAEALFSGGENEGQMTERRKRIVSKKPLAAAVRALGLDKMLRAGRGETTPSEKTVSDIFEAVAAAVYLDGGLDAARAFVRAKLPLAADKTPNYKGDLQEWLQARGFSAPRYETVRREGEAHAPRFTVRALGADLSAEGEGKSLRAAQKDAARALLARLRADGGTQ